MCALVSTSSFAKGECIGWVLCAEYRTVSLCALSSSLIDECCSVSLLVSCFAAAKLHHIAGRSLHRPPASIAGLVSQVRAIWYLPSFFSLFFRNPLFDKQVRQMMSSTQEATLSSSRTTTSLSSRIVPKAAACGLLVMETPLDYLKDS